ncbi:hypothetical protein TERTU_0506 [Teredinibacter turnerae T7901]|uniref:Uncharacterized protein n=1 Tax=Teredinibacter turnerae (strain ATCC 39867 / T7901) TaxID=377629 RepID=C5BN12_TERTT|nr:hypothetical protein TERTU_0506 [Teredinibacter turnerae T7901]
MKKDDANNKTRAPKNFNLLMFFKITINFCLIQRNWYNEKKYDVLCCVKSIVPNVNFIIHRIFAMI